MSDVLVSLQRWYANQCNADWEHRYGIHIGTLDNPGWELRIDIEGTPLQHRPFEPLELGLEDASSENWYKIWKEGGKFHGVGDSAKLEFILTAFLSWADSCPPG